MTSLDFLLSLQRKTKLPLSIIAKIFRREGMQEHSPGGTNGKRVVRHGAYFDKKL